MTAEKEPELRARSVERALKGNDLARAFIQCPEAFRRCGRHLTNLEFARGLQDFWEGAIKHHEAKNRYRRQELLAGQRQGRF